MTDPQNKETILTAEYTEKPAGQETPKKEPGLLSKFGAYVKKNQAAEAERRKRTGEPSFTEELSAFGSDWSKNLTKGMAQVGREEEAKLDGRSGRSGGTKIVQDDDDFANDILFGSSGTKKPVSVRGGETGGTRPVNDVYAETHVIQKFCEFLRYVNEDDDVELYQRRGTHFVKVDYKYLSKLLTRFYGHKITLKERDLSIK